MSQKNRLTFNNNTLRVGGTSWVIPGTFETNLRELSKDVTDMEIVLFETPEYSNIPTKEEVAKLKDVCEELDMTCNVHFPVGVCHFPDMKTRIECEDLCLRTIDLFAPMNPFGWVLHLVGEIRGSSPTNNMEKWKEITYNSTVRLASAVDDKKKICAETLDYKYEYVYDIVQKAGISVCFDIGHITLYGYPPYGMMDKYLANTRIIHLHGVNPSGEDHVSTEYFDKKLLTDLIKRCNDGKERVMSLEVFENDYNLSVNDLRTFCDNYKIKIG
ncbi:MAG: cobamide remodeling phosphodiesterase CbiR [Synergistaceae bacterium]